MTASTSEEASRQSLHGSWPLKFFQARPHFNRKAENQPYIEWLKDYLSEVDEAGEEEEEEDVDENRDEEYAADDESVCVFEFVSPHERPENLDQFIVFHFKYLRSCIKFRDKKLLTQDRLGRAKGGGERGKSAGRRASRQARRTVVL